MLQHFDIYWQYLSVYFWFISGQNKRDDLLCMGYTWPQLRTELVQKATGSRQRAKKDCFSGLRVSLSDGVVAIGWWWSSRSLRWIIDCNTQSTCTTIPVPYIPYSVSATSMGTQTTLLGPLDCLPSPGSQNLCPLLSTCYSFFVF